MRPDLAPLLVDAFGQTVYMVLITLVVGGFFGLVIGLGLYLTRPGNLLANRGVFAVLNLAVNVVRPVPFLIFLVALGPVTRAVVGTTIGIEAFTFAMCVMASFVFARLVEQNLVSIDPGSSRRPVRWGRRRCGSSAPSSCRRRCRR